MAKTKKTDITVRPAQPGDVSALSALARESYSAAFGNSMASEDLASYLAKTRSSDAFRTAMETDTILIAAISDQMVGYVQVCDCNLPVADPQPGDQQIEALYVRPDRQGLGVGRTLLQAALRHPRTKQATSIYLDVWEENRRAVDLYAMFGFKPVGRHAFRVDGRVVGEDVIMVRSSAWHDQAGAYRPRHNP